MPESFLDLLIIGAYFFVVLVLGWIKRKDLKGEDYLLMGRQLTLPGFVLSLVSTWYGGVLGSSEYSYTTGLSTWFIFGVPYYIFAAIFALVLARKARERYVVSIPEMIAATYGDRSRIFSGILVLILATPAPYVLTLGVLLHFLFGIPVVYGIIMGALFSFLYVYRDGLAVIIRTDLLQCLLMYGGYFLLIAFAWGKWGSPAELATVVVKKSDIHLSLSGGKSISYVLVWFFIASWTLVSPMFHQRVYALKNKKAAVPGIFSAIALWAVFDCFTTLAGLYAFAHLPTLEDPRLSHLILAENILPVGAYGFFITGIFAVVMSTLDSELFVSGVTLGPDLLGRIQKLAKLDEAILTRIGMAIVILSAIILAVFVPSVVNLFYTIGTLAVPGLLFPVLSATGIMAPVPARWAILHLALVPLASLSWYLAGRFAFPPLASIEPFYPGMLLSALIWILGWTIPPNTPK